MIRLYAKRDFSIEHSTWIERSGIVIIVLFCDVVGIYMGVLDKRTFFNRIPLSISI